MKRQRTTSSKTEEEAAGAPATSVNDDLLRLILLRLDSPIWLIRAASACKRWGRAVAGDDGGASFLRLARSLHPPAVVGRYHSRWVPSPIVFVPSSSWPAAAHEEGGFSLDFLPAGAKADYLSKLDVADCHGGLVLLLDRNKSSGGPFLLPGLVVCDPVLYQFYDDGPPHHLGCVTSAADSDDGDWRFLPRPVEDVHGNRWGDLAGRVDGSLYIGLVDRKMLVLQDDNARLLEFSVVDLPTRVEKNSEYQCTTRLPRASGLPPSTW
ncbi:hypothetical protein PR202_gb24278 [Eleusine coracana subsp. coracana]|uniref:F-box domain-containing protein n=1 Tax=Eleusine coracana subsp. coracana TaxID=191504 RepID=A0AAV5FL18_ELECO|nr:hypothetical protein QOZ80_5BG0446460 [Eleusine coracana subsp. coracana]GJN35495.1 hypothetical protein PR202_gb24278 [Eleusine coracana subsp. coracana]